MTCRVCRNFSGDLCASCRTVKRLKFLLRQGYLPVEHEAKVIDILRSAAGALTDLYEEFGRPTTSGDPSDGAGGSDGAAPALSASAGTPGKKAKKEAKKAKKEEIKALKRQARSAGVEEAPESEKEDGKESEEDPEKIREKKAAPLDEGEIRKKIPKKGSQEEVDSYVASHPETFGLGSISVRGSAGRHLRENDERRRAAPPEPAEPPRDRTRDSDHPRDQRRERSRSKRKKKTKGGKHRERGREYWRRVREQERWRRNQREEGPQRQRPRGR